MNPLTTPLTDEEVATLRAEMDNMPAFLFEPRGLEQLRELESRVSCLTVLRLLSEVERHRKKSKPTAEPTTNPLIKWEDLMVARALDGVEGDLCVRLPEREFARLRSYVQWQMSILSARRFSSDNEPLLDRSTITYRSTFGSILFRKA